MHWVSGLAETDGAHFVLAYKDMVLFTLQHMVETCETHPARLADEVLSWHHAQCLVSEMFVVGVQGVMVSLTHGHGTYATGRAYIDVPSDSCRTYHDIYVWPTLVLGQVLGTSKSQQALTRPSGSTFRYTKRDRSTMKADTTQKISRELLETVFHADSLVTESEAREDIVSFVG